MSAEPEPAGSASTTRDVDNCATPTGERPARTEPVDPTDADAAADRLAYVLAHDAPDGAPLPWLAERVFDREPTRADRTWTKRAARSAGHRTVPVGQFTFVYPRWTRYVGVDAEDDGSESASGSTYRSGTTVSRPSTAATNAERSLRASGRRADWPALTGALRGYHAGASGGERTRSTKSRRALDGCDSVAETFAGAARTGHRAGIVLTATTDPARFDSLGEASDDVLSDAAALRDKLGREADLGARPPGVTAVEPTSTGLPHVHIACFGVDAADVNLCELKRFWCEERGRGYQLDVQPIYRRPGERGPLAWRWGRPADARGEPERDTCPPARYLAASSRALASVAKRGPEDAPDYAERVASWFLASDLPTTNGGTRALRDAAAPSVRGTDVLPSPSPEPPTPKPPSPSASTPTVSPSRRTPARPSARDRPPPA